MLLVKAFVLVLLGLVSRKAAFFYVGADIGLFLLIKVLRDDFYYWMPLDGYIGIIVSLLCRVIGKVVTDFTSNGESKKKMSRRRYFCSISYRNFIFVFFYLKLMIIIFRHISQLHSEIHRKLVEHIGRLVSLFLL